MIRERLRDNLLRLVWLVALVLFARPVPGIITHVSNEPTIFDRYAPSWFAFVLAYLLFVVGLAAGNIWLWYSIRRGLPGQWSAALRPLHNRPWLLAVAVAIILSSGTLLWSLFLGRMSFSQMAGAELAVRAAGPLAMLVTLLSLRDRPYALIERNPPALVLVFLIVNGFVVYNTIAHPSHLNYDGEAHIQYMEALSFIPPRLPTPEDTPGYYYPPLAYVFPSAIHKVCGLSQRLVGLPDISCLRVGAKVGQLQNILLSVALSIYLVRLAGLVRPGSTSFRVMSLFLLGMLPVFHRTFAYLRGEPFLAFLAVFVAHRLLLIYQTRDFGPRNTLALGLGLALAILARQWGFFLFPAMGLWVLILLYRQHRQAFPLLKVFVAAVVIAALLGGWPYVLLRVQYGAFDTFRHEPSRLAVSNQPPEFYFGLGDGQLFADPTRPNFANQFIPTFYSDTWGDHWEYFLIRHDLLDTQIPYLARVNVVSLYPTLIFFGGVVLGCVYAVRAFARHEDIPHHLMLSLILLIVIVSMLGFFWFLVTYPRLGKGSNIKATYILQVFPFAAVLGAELLERVKQRSALAFTVLVALLAAVFGHNLGAVVTQWAFVLSAAGTMPQRIVPVIPDDSHRSPASIPGQGGAGSDSASHTA